MKKKNGKKIYKNENKNILKLIKDLFQTFVMNFSISSSYSKYKIHKYISEFKFIFYKDF